MPAPVATTPLAGLTAAEVMSPGLLACERDAPVRELAEMMAVNEVHAVALPDGSGVVTTLDIVASPEAATAADLASSPATVLPDEPLEQVARVIAETGRSHVVVVGPSSALPLGVVSTLDVAAVLAGREPRAARVVRPRPARPALSTSRLDRVSVGDAMHPGIFTVPAGASLRELATALVDHRVHMLVVDDAIVDDIAIARAAAAGAPTAEPSPIERIEFGLTLDVAADTMARTASSHLLVVRDGSPVGVLSDLDVVDVLAVR